MRHPLPTHQCHVPGLQVGSAQVGPGHAVSQVQAMSISIHGRHDESNQVAQREGRLISTKSLLTACLSLRT
eukprot:m.627124 g.627124  ORF g.627124 m.627124 type:complete len:71 (-) comp58252_c1_seq2:300-512(-)